MQRAAKLAAECADAQAFFTPDNLALLESWGGDERNPQPFTIHRHASSVIFVLQDKSRTTLQTIWPKMPSLSALLRIVDAGIELDSVLKRHKL
jgi:hypothetical protein